MADVIQVRSDDIEEIQKTFNKEEEAIGALKSKLAGANDKLKTGWIGLGSEAYFKEADEKVLPAVQRLQDALSQASQTLGKIHQDFGEAEAQAAAPIKNPEQGATSPSTAAQNGQTTQAGGGQQQGAGGASGGGGGAGRATGTGSSLNSASLGSTPFSSGLRGDALTSDNLASRLQNTGFGNLGDLRNRGLSSLSSGSDFEPRDFSSSLGSSLGSGSGVGGGGSGGGGSAGGGGSLGSVQALRGYVDNGVGLGGTPTGGSSALTYSGLGGFGGPLGARTPDFGVPIAIAAVSPFAALLGKVVKDRTERQ